ncbi:MAG: thiamine phosphate synthase [Gemmatimonadales bacterium]|jgi:thiamine-phosphate pyrophosphorylase
MSPLDDALRLVVILDADAAGGRDLAALGAAAVAGGATMLQVRAKRAGARELVALVHAVRARAGGVPVLVNDRLDVALAAPADGCHLGQDDLPLYVARLMVPPGFLLGGSAGTPEEALRAAAQHPDYLGIGPVATSPTKRDAGAAIGWAGFSRVHAAAPALPAVGIGGIDADLAAFARSAGAAGVAVIGAVLTAWDPEAATRALRQAVGA